MHHPIVVINVTQGGIPRVYNSGVYTHREVYPGCTMVIYIHGGIPRVYNGGSYTGRYTQGVPWWVYSLPSMPGCTMVGVLYPGGVYLSTYPGWYASYTPW